MLCIWDGALKMCKDSCCCWTFLLCSQLATQSAREYPMDMGVSEGLVAFAVKNDHTFREECSFKEGDYQFRILNEGSLCG